VADLWEGTVRKHGARPSIVFEGKTYTFTQIDQRACESRPRAPARAFVSD
jgi:hypothetical protein